MSKISFYLFEKSPERQVQSACRLCRKILRHPAKIWIHCPELSIQNELDDLLWSFDPQSFLTHGIDDQSAAICISSKLPETQEWIVFNFHIHALEDPSRFSHIIEIIENNEAAKEIGREKYKTYRKLGISPQTHKL
ncbi:MULTISPECIES: DNA polymerase III subunit chi [unclassified Acinetobacter]|uniref:DNA polymerase III subunit chi n=1 Tax=unclassified Acinetobacter TaxID=196816 RepID=UPI0008B87F49|nr:MULTISPECIES: DNA polymerase III subunit chi [unclassified Acinetobacter]SEL96388.1 DNA polymerase III, chi subunit [Acinetobacter sp. DSM 11652]